MADIEKVVKGLECCTSNCCMTIKCDECPYGNICYREGRCGTMMLDAIKLLKEQQAINEHLSKEVERLNKLLWEKEGEQE